MKQKATVYPIKNAPNLPESEPIVLESSSGITLRCGEASLRLLPSGELQLNGQTLKLEANQNMLLKATQVRVNCED
jgi:hypothetical protein